jgi:hypothetical protein
MKNRKDFKREKLIAVKDYRWHGKYEIDRHLHHGFGVKRGKAICTCKILQVQKYSFCSLICLLTHMNTVSISSKKLAVITRYAVSSNARSIMKAE